jgi:hypothetical protein
MDANMLNLSHAVVTKRNTEEWENAIWELYDSDRFAGAATDAKLNIVQHGMARTCREFNPISPDSQNNTPHPINYAFRAVLREAAFRIIPEGVHSVTIKNKNVLNCVFAGSIR